MCNELVGKVNGDISQIFQAVKVSLTGGHNTFRLHADHVVHDRQVVRSEVPDYVNVVLKESQVHPGGVVVVELSELAVVDQFLHLANRAGEKKGVVDHQPQVFLFG